MSLLLLSACSGARQTPDAGTCTRITDCQSGEFCDLSSCGAGSAGVCKPRQVTCPPTDDPVCGCDGRRYTNACVAQAAGMSIGARGECPDAGTGGGNCTASSPCRLGAWCDFSSSGQVCGAAASLGLCKPKPPSCSGAITPVCGCDGITYSNACLAHAAGVDVASNSACIEKRCTAELACPRGFVCDYDPDTCGAALGEGRCRPIPEVCPSAACAPACGCDGVTYCSPCLARAAGVDVAREGACAEPPCDDARPCLASEYCDRGANACGSAGVCRVRPLAAACPAQIAPACGCDDHTYENACAAAAAGTGVAFLSDCETGRVCTRNADCRGASYCLFAANNCGAAGSGHCAPIPAGCKDPALRVCGCDGLTYDSACLAAFNGVDVLANVACDEPIPCGTTSPCPGGFLCTYADASCGAGGRVGLCEAAPSAAECAAAPAAPICGCDGRTYPSACDAKYAGIDVRSAGACERACGGRGNAPCDAEEYCDYPGNACGADDRGGVCRARPDVCAPPASGLCPFVCGCDGLTYCTECDATRAGADGAREGPCPASTESCSSERPCANGYTCQYELRSCGTTGEVGRCGVRPRFCAPGCTATCGCNGADYCSRCDALQHGVDIAGEGACN